MVSVIWIVVFGGMNSNGADVEETLTLPELKALFSRPIFIIYFSILNVVIAMFLTLGLYAFWVITMDDASGQLRKTMNARMTKLLGSNRFTHASGLTLSSDEEDEGGKQLQLQQQLQQQQQQQQQQPDLRIKKVVAMIMSASGGLLASETLLLAKSGVRLITSSLSGRNQFQDSLSYFILAILLLTAVLQVYCLNTALKIYDSVLVVPVFYGFYTTFGLINSIIYLNQLQNYHPWVLLLIMLGIGVLIFGVRMLSAPKEDLIPVSEEQDQDSDSNDHDGDDELRAKLGGSGGTLASASGMISREKNMLTKNGGEEQKESPRHPAFGSGDVQQMQHRQRPPLYPPNRRATGTSSVTTKGSFLMSSSLSRKGSRDGSILMADAENMNGKENKKESWHESESENENEHAQARRRGSMPQGVLKALTLHEKRASLELGGRESAEGRRRSMPKIDTNVGSFSRGRSLTPKDPTARVSGTYSRPMSPSEFRAQYTNSPFPIKPKHLQERDSLNNSRSSSPAASPRRLTGNAKIDQIFEDLNPFRVFRRGSLAGDGSTGGLTNTSLSAFGAGPRRASTSSLPSSPSRAHSSDRWYGRHIRQDSFTGRPSEWEEPNRRQRHSMLFGENGRSSSVGSRASSRTASPAPSARHSRQNSHAEMGGSAFRGWHAGKGMGTGAGVRPGPGTGLNPVTGGPLSPLPIHEGNEENPTTGLQPSQQQKYPGHPHLHHPLSTGGQSNSSSNIHSHSHIRSQSNGGPVHYRSVSSTHGRQLSFTTKNDQGIVATVLGLSDGSSGVGGSHGTEGGGGAIQSSAHQQLQQLQQHHHYPTSQLQHSLTTSSISTIGSTLVPSLSTSTSLAQLGGFVSGEGGGGT
ncbi:hypothetical protein BGZ94_004525, partial [Podila epigama]